MDTNDYYTLLVPIFLALMAADAWLARKQGLRSHYPPDTIANLSCGLGQILVGIFTGGMILGTYSWALGRIALFHWSRDSILPWAIAFPLVDFCYYWFHRCSHRINALWVIHAVHHQSEEMNISVALRQPWFSDFSAFLFYWPLPLLGVPRAAFFFAVGCLSLYQVLLHTRLFAHPGRWGWLFNTPAHHRLHHAIDAAYRDRNFGSMLIIWDRLFGTFAREKHAPHFGIAPRFASWNPLWAQVAPLAAVIATMRRARRPFDSLRVWWKPPEWKPPEARLEDVVTPPTIPPRTVVKYARVQFIVIGIIALTTLWREQYLGATWAVILVAVVLAGTGLVGALLDGTRFSSVRFRRSPATPSQS